jgi:hypothetical protein
MLFRIGIDDKLDLSHFKKHIQHYFGSDLENLTYNIFLKDFKILVQVLPIENKKFKEITILLYEKLPQQKYSNEYSWRLFNPAIDSRFSEIKLIQELFEKDKNPASLECLNAKVVADKICNLIKIVHKIKFLTAFI